MSKWTSMLWFDFERDEFILTLKEKTYRRDQSDMSTLTTTESSREVKSFHKDSDVQWMREQAHLEMNKVVEEFQPSDNYIVDFVGDRFIGNHECNVLLVKDRLDRKEVIFVAKTYTQDHAKQIVDALNATKPETITE